MKPKHSFEPHLLLREIVVSPGGELPLGLPGWHLLRVSAGVGYWLHPRANLELAADTVLVFSECGSGVVRASQVGELTIDLFRVQPDRLTGVVSFGEQQFLQKLAAADPNGVRCFSPATPIADKFQHLCRHTDVSSLSARLKMLELFVDAFEAELLKFKPAPEPALDAKARLVKLLHDTPRSELLNLTFADLVKETRCTPRHLSRIFQQVVGMTFRQKQAQVRLVRAQELLATTQSKVVEVALESGYQSACLFNIMFKRRFGMTPARWRDQTRKTARRPSAPLTLLRT